MLSTAREPTPPKKLEYMRIFKANAMAEGYTSTNYPGCQPRAVNLAGYPSEGFLCVRVLKTSAMVEGYVQRQATWGHEPVNKATSGPHPSDYE